MYHKLSPNLADVEDYDSADFGNSPVTFVLRTTLSCRNRTPPKRKLIGLEPVFGCRGTAAGIFEMSQKSGGLVCAAIALRKSLPLNTIA